MKVQIRDKKALEEVRPRDVLAYLSSTGWEKKGRIGDAATLWQRPLLGMSSDMITLPMRTDFADYARRIADLIETISKREQRSQLGVLKDLLLASTDTFRFRLKSPDTGDGSIDLDRGVDLVSNAREAVFSAARSAVTPKPCFRGHAPGKVNEYLSKVRLGQTERGSYIVTIVSPLNDDLDADEAEAWEVHEDTFARKVSTTFVEAVSAAKTATRMDDPTRILGAFDTAVESGVSSNLCSALAEMGAGLEDDGMLELGVSWAKSRKPPEDVDPSGEMIEIGAGSIALIKTAAEALSRTREDETLTIYGHVIRLERAITEQGGDAYIEAKIDGGIRKIKVRLESDFYDIAIKAHHQQYPVTCRGLLQKEGRYLTIDHPDQFELGDRRNDQAPGTSG